MTDSMRFPIFAGLDGNSVRTIPTGATQPFTPEPFYTYPVFPGQDDTDLPDTTAPILVSASPTDGSTDVPVNTEIVLVFDEDVVAGAGMIHLMTGPVDDPLTTPVESHVSVEMFAATDPRVQIDGNRVRVALQSTLDPDTTYHLDIGSGGDTFLDLAGNGYQRDHADYNFTTTDGVGVDFTITWPGSDTWMGVGNTATIYGQVNNVTDVVSMSATIQNVETGLYQRTDGTFGEVDYFDITVNTYDGHWFFLHTPAAGGTYRVEVFATDRAQTVTSRSATFSVHGDLPSGPADPPVEDPPVEDPPSDPPASGPDLDLVAETTSVSLLVDPETGLAYVQDASGEPILISRFDEYWSGDVPLTRDGSSLQAAARDELGRLRVLDIGQWGAFAWILDESGLFIGEESPSDTSDAAKESLFQFDINGDGVIGQSEESTPPATPPADPDPGADVLADGVRVRMMSFNVFYASLGAPERIDGIAQAIADYTPDVASIQEMWGEKDQILAAIEAKTGLDYAFSTGSNTWDGDILYRADRWRILDDGVITYDGSRGMSYATLEHLSTGERMSVYGMHPLSAVSEELHLRNMEMATAHMAASPYAGQAPVVLLGDMNAHENSESMRLIRDGSLNAFGQNWSAPVTFEDTFRVANGDAADGNTGFGVKIDYVFVEEREDAPFRVEGASIRSDAPGGSDHFPVMAEVVLL
ncbi:MAG: Ig-like domain-containing protein, partial [Planctomycetaceae bacterium]